MDQYDYLTRDQLLGLLRTLGDGGGPAYPRGCNLPEFGERVRREFEASSLPMRIFDHGTLRYLAVNDAALKFYGYTREEFLGLTLRDTRHPDERGLQRESLVEADGFLRHGSPRRQVRKFGEVVVVEVVVQDILYEGRRARLSVTLDMTPRLRTQELLWRRQQEFEALAENLPDLVLRYDRDHRFLYVNAAAEKAFSIERGGIIGRAQCDIGLPGEIASLFKESLAGVFATGEPRKFEFRLAPSGGERVYEVEQVPEFDSSGTIGSVICVARDVTERKEAELAAQRSAEFSRLLESLAHAANEAVTPEAAMAACLKLICTHGSWDLGRVMIYGRNGPTDRPVRSLWQTAAPERFASLMRMSERHIPDPRGPFIGRLLKEQAPVWREDIEREPGFTRQAAMLASGLRSAFAFPVIVRGNVVAVIEVFSTAIHPRDPLTMGAAQSLASQLARIIEREAAHQADARMAAIVESSQDAIISRALDGTILTWNTGAERLFGYTAAEIVGRNLALLYLPERRAKMFRRQKLVLQGKAVPTIETARLTKDGRHIMVSLSSAPMRDSSGEVFGISTIMRDVTEGKRAEQALRESEERFRQLAENMAQVFWIDTPAVDGNMYVSPAFEKIWGRSRESLRRDPNSWKDAIHPDDRGWVGEAFAAVAGGQQLDVEYRIIRPDGTMRWIRDRSYPMKAGDGSPLICGIAEDVTEARQAEQNRLTHAVHQRDALVREVHHRIKNNLQGVIGLLRQRIRRNPAITRDIEETISQLQSVALVYGLQETRADGLLDLSEMIEAICGSAEGLVGGHVDRLFERRSSRPACVVGAEAVSIAVALNELLFNAFKHQPAVAGRKYAKVRLSETADTAEIRITNRGRLPKRFDFITGRGVGNGLGLVKMLLASPGGSLSFRNGRGKVEVTLALAVPLLAGRTQRYSRRMHDGDATGTEKAAAARPGRGRRQAGARRAG